MSDKCFVLSPKGVKRLSREQARPLSKCLNAETERLFGNIESVEEVM